MRRLLFILLLLIPSPLLAQRPCSPNSGPFSQPATGARTDVQAAVNSASDGAVICLPEGTWTWDGGIEMSNGGTKGVEVRGAGDFVPMGSAGKTTIHVRDASGSTFSGYASGNYPMVIDNLRFQLDSQTVNGNEYGVLNFVPRPAQIGGTLLNGRDFIIHHNDFTSTDGCGAPRWIYAGTRGGIIYRNRLIVDVNNPSCNFINQNREGITHKIADDTVPPFFQTSPSWGATDTDGRNNLYIENNYFEGFNVMTDVNNSGREVFRFNDMHGATFASHGADTAPYGNRHFEIYKSHWFCDIRIGLNSYIGQRAAGFMALDNIFDPVNASLCGYGRGSFPPIVVYSYRTGEGGNTVCWPGLYMDTYPIRGQAGWGWFAGTSQLGNMNRPDGGLNGRQQALDPIYIAGNTGNAAVSISNYSPGGCRAQARSAQAKTMGSTLGAIQRVSAGQTAVVVFADLVGGTAPSIRDNLGQNWTKREGGENSGMRLSLWTAPITVSGAMTVNIDFDSSSSARAGTLITLNSAGAFLLNPAVLTDNTSPYTGPPTGTLSTNDAIVLGYFALNGPTATASSGAKINDNIAASLPHLRATSGGVDASDIGIIGTTGDAATSNVTVGVTYRFTSQQVDNNNPSSGNASVTPTLANTTANRNGLAGTIAFANAGNPDMKATDFIAEDREYYQQKTAFNGTTGTGSGPRSARPQTCTKGVGYWSTDVGNWNMSGAGGQGVLDVCTSDNVWNAGNDAQPYYTPYRYPHPDANIIATGNINFFTQQPVNTPTGSSFSPVVTGAVYPPAPDSVTVSLAATSANCPLSPTTMTVQANSDGQWSLPGLGLVAGSTPVAGCKLKIHNNTNSAAMDIESNPFTMKGIIMVTTQPSTTLLGTVMTPPVAVSLTPPAPGATLQATVTGPCRLNGGTMVTTTGTTFPNLTATVLGTNCTLQIVNTSNTAYEPVTSQSFGVDASLTFGSDFDSNRVTQWFGYQFFSPVCRSGIPEQTGELNGITIWYVIGPSDTARLRAAIYADTGANRPGALIAQTAGETSLPNTSGITAYPMPLLEMPTTMVQAGTKYWLCVKDQSGTGGILYYDEQDQGVQQMGAAQFNDPFGTPLSGIMNRGFFIAANYVPNVPNQPPCASTDIHNGWTCVAVTGDHLGANGGTSSAIDTTNAGANNLLIAGIVAHELVNPMCTPTDNKGNTYTPLGKTSSQGNAIAVRLFYKTNGTVGANHTITCTGTDTYPVSIFAAYKPASPNQTIVENGFAPTANATSIQPGAVTPNAADALVVTLVGTSVLANAMHTINAGFSEPVDVPGVSIPAYGGNIGGALAHLTMAAPASVNPTWSWNGQAEIPAARIAVFNTVNNVVTPVLSFTAQPSNTVSGETMGAFTVTASTSISGTVTLQANNCAGASFSNLTATISGTSVTFSMTLATGTASGCSFTASFPGATSAISATFNVTANVIPPMLSTDLISYWKMDETSGQALDSCSVNHLQATGTIGSQAGIIGTARSQTATNSTRQNYLSIPSNPSLQVNGSFSVSLWTYLLGDVTRQQVLIAKDTQTAPNRDWVLQTSGGEFGFTLFQGGVNRNVTSSLTIQANRWYHVVFWFDQNAGTINLEVRQGANPVRQYSTLVGSAAPDWTSAPFSVFSRSTSAADFYGAIDEVAFAKRVWSADERALLFNNGAGYPYSNFPCGNLPGATLVFTQPPTDTINGNAFTPAVSGTRTGTGAAGQRGQRR